MKLINYLIRPARKGFSFGIQIININTLNSNLYGIQFSTKKPFLIPKIKKIFNDDKSYILGWLFCYLFKINIKVKRR